MTVTVFWLFITALAGAGAYVWTLTFDRATPALGSAERDAAPRGAS